MQKLSKNKVIFICILAVTVICSGCTPTKKVLLNPENPTVVTVWHCYNAYVKSIFDELVMEFNETVGAEQGIVIDAYAYGDKKKLEEALYNSANRMIGSDEMPHVFLAYADSAYRVNQLVPLVDLEDYFTQEEFARYRKEFLDEGMWDGSHKHKMIPVAKSTEVLYLNQTVWDSFSKETGTSVDQLRTWEGLAKVGERYYQWSGGKAFLGFNAFNDFQMITAAQAGNRVFSKQGKKVSFSYEKEVAQKVWDTCYVPHMKGWYSSNVYNQDLIKRGELVAYIGSSAGAGYFPSMVTISEDRIYPIQCNVFPYPVWEGGKPYIGHRGADMCVSASDSAHEYAATEFLKWFTEPQQNLKFTVLTGYIPVQEKALKLVPDMLQSVKSENTEAIEKSVQVTLKGMKEKDFYTREVFDDSYEMNIMFSDWIFKKIQSDLEEVDRQVSVGKNRDAVINQMIEQEEFEHWYEELTQSISDRLNQRSGE